MWKDKATGKVVITIQMGYMEDFSQGTIRLIGLVELLCAAGLILPAITGILPMVTPLAARGLVFTMIGAMLTHLRRKENAMIVVNLALLALAAVVVYDRFIVLPVV